MSDLSIGSFPDFMQEVTGFAPFPWQVQLLEQVVSKDDGAGWPDLLDLPTGTGKTSTLHIAVFALAMRPDIMPRRIVLVVDRRIIVDQVHSVASTLAEKLQAATTGISFEVANRLRACCAGKEPKPLRASILRGGVPRDNSWIETPEQPTIFASTVDQIGSRLLFRGYGVSPSMRPVHAGIVGTDTLYLLDEVHLATAFEKTLADIATYSGKRWREYPGTIGRPIHLVRMSATPRRGKRSLQTFALSEADRSHEILGVRLEASRPAQLQLVKTKSSTESKAHNVRAVANAAASAADQIARGGGRTIGVVMNRVATAVATARKLETTTDGRVLLITGRMRPFDRARRQREIDELARSGHTSSDGVKPIFVVATSCIEAGADYDFDGLVTEVASLPALRQRFGRLNRLGKHTHASAVILGSKHQLSKKAEPDPIYGQSLANTWRFLEEVAHEGRVDFGLSQFPEVPDALMETLRTPDAQPPTLLPSYLDQWSETRPAPHPDPDIALWLHGKDQDADRDVSIVFRADIKSPNSVGIDSRSAESLEFIPPLSEEAVSVPIYQAREFVEDRATAEVARVIRWRAEGPSVVTPGQISVGDVLIVPTAWGGLSQDSWDWENREPVADVAEAVYLARSEEGFGDGGLLLRVNPAVLRNVADIPAPPVGESAESADAWDVAEVTLRDWLSRPSRSDEESWLASLLRRAMSGSFVSAEASTDRSGETWLVSWRLKDRGLLSTTEDAVSSFSGMDVELEKHLDDVRAWAEGFAARAAVPTAIAEDVGLAAWLHDIGKADSRFQVLLRGGDPVAAHVQPPLAKSKMRTSRRARREATKRAGWPEGFRHELVSLALFEGSSELVGRAHDPDLVRHLIASHHGWCRPWAPSVEDPAPISVRFELGGELLEADTAVIDEELRFEMGSRFRRLCRRYGWHGLAYLEALLRLGDHQASRMPLSRPRDVIQ